MCLQMICWIWHGIMLTGQQRRHHQQLREQHKQPGAVRCMLCADRSRHAQLANTRAVRLCALHQVIVKP
jgi:hypothetical protein